VLNTVKFLQGKNLVAIVATACMISVALLAHFYKPREENRTKATGFILDVSVPTSFGDWRHDATAGVMVVNPETKALLDKIYSQILTRTYVNKSGQRVMLSVAYGSDQRGALQAHKPEICYPAQGFVVTSLTPGAIATPMGSVDATRMVAVKGNRFEPVTYWFTVGDQRVKTALERRVIELKAIMTGQIPDGLLFRVSSIDRDAKNGFATQDLFVNQLLSALEPAARARLAGVSQP
jgi:EpsI family protein